MPRSVPVVVKNSLVPEVRFVGVTFSPSVNPTFCLDGLVKFPCKGLSSELVTVSSIGKVPAPPVVAAISSVVAPPSANLLIGKLGNLAIF